MRGSYSASRNHEFLKPIDEILQPIATPVKTLKHKKPVSNKLISASAQAEINDEIFWRKWRAKPNASHRLGVIRVFKGLGR